MILTCASCATRYYADEASIPPQGRSVRCAACGNTWRVEKDLLLDNGAAQPATFVDEPKLTREQIERARRAAAGSGSPTAQARARQMQRQRLEKLRTAAVAWGAAGASLVLLLTGAVVFRQGVAKVWPNTASAYAAMGLSVNITGLEFSDLTIERNEEGEKHTLTVSGAVRNIGGAVKDAPVLRFGLLDRNADEVRTWMVSLGGPPIPPGGARQFSTVLNSPPVSAVDLEATFATAAEAKHAPAATHMAAVEPAHEAEAEQKDTKPKTGHAVGGSNPGALTVIEPGHGETAPAAGHAEPAHGEESHAPAH